MPLVARILGLSFLTAGIGVVLATFFGNFSEVGFLYVLFGCVGAIIGAIAGAAREVVSAKQQ